MAVKPLQRAELNRFVRGLITEASPLNFPEDASVDEANFDMKINGTRFRRLGMDREEGGIIFDTGITSSSLDSFEYNTFLWEHVGGDTSFDVVAVQIGNHVFFFKPAEENISVNGYAGFVHIPQFPETSRFFMAALEGYLVITCGADSFAIVEYDTNTQAFFATRDRIQIRDVFGIEEIQQPESETDPSFKPSVLNYEHYYNLYNQGWAIPRFDWVRWGNTLFDAVYLGSNKQQDRYPSNTDKVWLGIEYRNVGEDDDGQPNQVECFNYQQFQAVDGSEVDAARGYFIIDALKRGQSRVDQWNYHRSKYPQTGGLIPGSFSPRLDQTSGGPSCVADFAGRIWFSGFNGVVTDGDARSPNYNNYVFYSQLIKNKTDFRKCYQEGDPTSRESNDIVDTDGGFIRISEANNIISMFNLGSRLIVIASNGVWSIVGGSDYGFTATNYRVDKLSTFGGLTSSSVVVEGNIAYYWASDGIYLIGPNEFGDFSVTNITAQSIKTYYNSIPELAKRQAFGVYDRLDKRVRWLYRANDKLSETIEFRELILDVQLEAFFPFVINKHPNFETFLVSGFRTPPFNTRLEEDSIYVKDEPVIAGTEDVVGFQEVISPSNATIKYVSLSIINGNLGIYFSKYYNTRFRDWYSFDNAGIDAEAFLLTGDQTAGDVAINKQIPYLTMSFYQTEKNLVDGIPDIESSCIGRIQWDFTNARHSNRWSREVQLYRPSRYYMSEEGGSIDNGYNVLVTKTKMRGRGKSFALYMTTEPLKDCQILGWNLTVTSNGVT